MKAPVCIDIETSGKEPKDGGRLLSIGWRDMSPGMINTFAKVPERDCVVWKFLADPEIPIIEFTKYDARWLIDAGYEVNGPIYDVQVMAWEHDENQDLSLDDVALRYLDLVMDKRVKRAGNKIYFICDDAKKVLIEDAPQDQLDAYCKRDVDATVLLFKALWELLQQDGMLSDFLNEQVPYTRELIELELTGMPIDIDASERLRKELEIEHEALAVDLSKSLPKGFNLDSPKQVRGFLFEEEFEIKRRIPLTDGKYPKGFTPEKVGRLWVHGRQKGKGLHLTPHSFTDAGVASVSRSALMGTPETAAHPWIKEFLEYQRLDQLLTMFLRKFPEVVRDGRIYAHFNQTGTVTGRLSSSDINLQQIPVRHEWGKAVRGLFCTNAERPLILGDYEQLEVRLMAHWSGDPLLLKICREGLDFHSITGTRVFGKDVHKGDPEREISKRLVFAMGYGAMENKIALVLTSEGYPTNPAEAFSYLQELRDTYPTFFRWRDFVIAQARDRGYIETIGGRRRRVESSFKGSWKTIGYGERAAANAIIQGSAGDVVRRTMLRFHRPALRCAVQVHDELVYQYQWKVDPRQEQLDLKQLQYVAEKGHGFDLRVPLKFEPVIALSWAEKG